MQTTVLGGHLVPEWQGEDGWKAAPSGRVVHGRVAFWPQDHPALARALAAGELAPVEQVSDLNRLFAPDPTVVVRMAAYLEDLGLSVDPPRSGGLYLDFSGTVGQLTGAFRCTFAERPLDGRMVRINREDPEVPLWAAPHVAAIFGLETRSTAHPMHRYPSRNATPANGGQGFFPRDLTTAYAFPTGATGAGETIALLEFSNGFAVADLEQFWSQHGVPVRSVGFVSVDGTPNDGGIHAVDMECTLDVEWAGAMAPSAQLVVYEATAGTSDAGFALSMVKTLDAVATDVQHRPTVVSISYGAAEDRFAPSALNAWNVAAMRLAARGITVLAASGDAGAYGIRGAGRLVPHVDVPAAVPHILAVGGTTLTLTPTDQRLTETGWTDTNNNGASGGGVSQVFPRPAWQDTARVPANPAGHAGRGVPDLALVADPDTGYSVVFQGQPTVVGGTSAASPVWAALIARLNQQRVQQTQPRLGFANPALYALGGTAGFHPILVGNNSMPGVVGYQCGPGWNAVTGWGSPDGTALASRLG
ncbi:MAG: S53 family peptidase [Thermaerobacter sp.]|nr:S53 family peptidase [Thermaerobacter sp.]